MPELAPESTPISEAVAAPDTRRLGWLWAAAVLFALSTLFAFTQPPRPNPLRPGPAFPRLGWWKHPIERNGMWRLDGVTTYMRGVFSVPDGRHAWAVGSDGTILATADSGASWQPRTSNTTQDLGSVGFVDAQRGWAVGRNGTILATTDGGASWQPQTSAEALASVGFVDAQRGWVVGGNGTILATADGGASWEPQTSDTAEHLLCVAFVDAQRGWAVGLNGTILATTDGGASWEPRASNTTEDLLSVGFVDAQRGWVVGASPEFSTRRPPSPRANRGTPLRRARRWRSSGRVSPRISPAPRPCPSTLNRFRSIRRWGT